VSVILPLFLQYKFHNLSLGLMFGLLGLVGKMYSRIQSRQRASGLHLTFAGIPTISNYQ